MSHGWRCCTKAMATMGNFSHQQIQLHVDEVATVVVGILKVVDEEDTPLVVAATIKEDRPGHKGHKRAVANPDVKFVASQIMKLLCWYRYDESYQGTSKMAGSATTSYGVDTKWYVDSGASDHITTYKQLGEAICP
jgi:hypothetical protein